MFKSLLATALLSSGFATGAMAASPSTKAPMLAKPAIMLAQQSAMKKMHKCKRTYHYAKGKCISSKK